MKSIIIFGLLCLTLKTFYAQTYYVKPSGDNSLSGTSYVNALETLYGAYKKLEIEYPNNIISQNVTIYVDGDVIIKNVLIHRLFT